MPGASSSRRLIFYYDDHVRFQSAARHQATDVFIADNEASGMTYEMRKKVLIFNFENRHVRAVN